MRWKQGKLKRQLPTLTFFYCDLDLDIADIAYLLNRTSASIRRQVKSNRLRRSQRYKDMVRDRVAEQQRLRRFYGDSWRNYITITGRYYGEAITKKHA